MIDDKTLDLIQQSADDKGRGIGSDVRGLIAEVRRLREIEEQMKREHAHHHIAPLANCAGCAVLVKS